jgi:hypothetical protein
MLSPESYEGGRCAACDLPVPIVSEPARFFASTQKSRASDAETGEDVTQESAKLALTRKAAPCFYLEIERRGSDATVSNRKCRFARVILCVRGSNRSDRKQEFRKIVTFTA